MAHIKNENETNVLKKRMSKCQEMYKNEGIR